MIKLSALLVWLMGSHVTSIAQAPSRYQIVQPTHPTGIDHAKAIAKQYGGHLVTVTSQAEWDSIKELVNTFASSLSLDQRSFPLGLTVERSRLRHYWVTGEPQVFSAWWPGDPCWSCNSDEVYAGGGAEHFWKTARDRGYTYTLVVIEREPDGDQIYIDTDQDGLTDLIEITIWGTDPLKLDSDEDGFSDANEIAFDSDPLDPKRTNVVEVEVLNIALRVRVPTRRGFTYQVQSAPTPTGPWSPSLWNDYFETSGDEQWYRDEFFNAIIGGRGDGPFFRVYAVPGGETLP